MPVNGYSLGRDCSISLVTPTGTLTLNGLYAFQAKPKYTQLESKPLNGVVNHAAIPQGGSGTFKLDRSDATVETYFTNFEAAYLSNGATNSNCTALETIQEADGSTSQWQYGGMQLMLEDSGNKEADKKVELTISFNYSTKTRLA